jgi:hypothetical protein
VKRCMFAILLLAFSCSAPRPIDPDIWHPAPSENAGDTVPGPLKNFGPFDSFADALKAACPLILSKPNASVVHLLGRDRQLASRVSTEYCAWLYYTPENKYELSMLTDLSEPGDDLNGEISCTLPTNVDDPRYPPGTIKYIFCVHNHPLSGEISKKDISFAAAMANAHGLIATAQGRQVPLAVIAFFSNSPDGEKPTCDGFYQYIPATRELLKWSNVSGVWRRDKYGTVLWTSPTDFTIQRDQTNSLHAP